MKASIAKLFKSRLKALRKAKGWTQEQAAEAIGIDYKLYQFYEIGVKDNPSLSTLEKLAKGYGLEVHQLLDPNLEIPE